MLESGIYLGRAAEHPADTRGNTIRDNLITGHGMKPTASRPPRAWT